MDMLEKRALPAWKGSDVMRTLVIYYDTNSWSLTPIGKINDLDEALLKETLGSGDVTVTFSLQS